MHSSAIDFAGSRSELDLDWSEGLNNIAAAKIRAALAELLVSDLFRKAQRMTRLLRFLVEKLLAGSTRDTTEYAIGLQVFERDPAAYSTGEDPIVRVQMGRLREKLKTYYATVGKHAHLIISIPTGSYMPVVRRAGRGSFGGDEHLLALMPLTTLGDDLGGAAFAAGLNEELSHRLFQQFGNKIVCHTFTPPSGALAGVSRLLEGSIRTERDLVRASFRLVDAGAGIIAWSEQFDHHGILNIALQEDLACAVCEAVKAYFLPK